MNNGPTEAAAPDVPSARSSRLAGDIVLLTLFMIAWGVPVALLAQGRWGQSGLISAVLAGLVCCSGSWLGLFAASHWLRMHPVNGMLLGILCRMGAAFVAGAFAVTAGWSFGFPECLLANYLFSLVVDTILAVRTAKKSLRPAGQSN